MPSDDPALDPKLKDEYARAISRLHRTMQYQVPDETLGPTNTTQGTLGWLFQRATAARALLDSPEEHEVMSFDEALERTLDFEGGGKVHKVAGDPGGTTKWGISARAFPGIDIENLSKEQAKLIYKNNYWNAVKADSLPEELAPHVFDAAVNMGPQKAAAILQRAINLIATTRGGPGVMVDGQIGDQTLTAAAAYKPDQLTTIFRHLRASEYVRLAQTGTMGKFLFGWLARA